MWKQNNSNSNNNRTRVLTAIEIFTNNFPALILQKKGEKLQKIVWLYTLSHLISALHTIQLPFNCAYLSFGMFAFVLRCVALLLLPPLLLLLKLCCNPLRPYQCDAHFHILENEHLALILIISCMAYIVHLNTLARTHSHIPTQARRITSMLQADMHIDSIYVLLFMYLCCMYVYVHTYLIEKRVF